MIIKKYNKHMIDLTNKTPVDKLTNKQKEKNTKFHAIFWSIVYLSLVIALCISGTWAFVKFYYYPIYVSGPSMEPTLNGGTDSRSRLDFGYIDTNSNAIDNIDRFDIITTFYPFSSEDYELPYVPGSKTIEGATHKIKRVMAIPGDTFTIRNDEMFLLVDGVEEKVDFPFKVKNATNVGNGKKRDFISKGFGDENGYITLKENEYWVMGDNWLQSKDSYSDTRGGPIYRENIVGVLIAIVGTCLVKDNEIYDRQFTIPTFYK